MSEIKAQLLGVLLVLAIFGAVGSILVGAFEKQANSIASDTTSFVATVA